MVTRLGCHLLIHCSGCSTGSLHISGSDEGTQGLGKDLPPVHQEVDKVTAEKVTQEGGEQEGKAERVTQEDSER